MSDISHISIDCENFKQALLKGDRKRSSSIAKNYTDSPESIKILYEQVIKPALYKVGELWEYNIITVASEHLATSVSESILNELYNHIISDFRVSKKIILGCVETEKHQVGIKMVADIFEMNGWDTFFLGADTPTFELINYAKQIKPDAIALSLSVYYHFNNLETMIKELRKVFPMTPILIGGQAFLRGGKEILLKFDNLFLFETLEEIENYIKNFK